MKIAEAILFFLIGFVGMEIFSWTIHKFIMHGPLWAIHRTHHTKTEGFFELNDFFSLFFGTISMILILSGWGTFDFRFWIGIGIASYGILYFVLHDVLIHRRVKHHQKIRNRYLQALARAHYDHHKSDQRDHAVCFGLLWVPTKYFRK